MTCRKQTVQEALAAAQRSKRRKLTPTEKRIISVAAKRAPVLLCGPTRRLEGVGGRRCKKVKRGSASFTVCK